MLLRIVSHFVSVQNRNTFYIIFQKTIKPHLAFNIHLYYFVRNKFHKRTREQGTRFINIMKKSSPNQAALSHVDTTPQWAMWRWSHRSDWMKKIPLTVTLKRGCFRLLKNKKPYFTPHPGVLILPLLLLFLISYPKRSFVYRNYSGWLLYPPSPLIFMSNDSNTWT